MASTGLVSRSLGESWRWSEQHPRMEISDMSSYSRTSRGHASNRFLQDARSCCRSDIGYALAAMLHGHPRRRYLLLTTFGRRPCLAKFSVGRPLSPIYLRGTKMGSYMSSSDGSSVPSTNGLMQRNKLGISVQSSSLKQNGGRCNTHRKGHRQHN